MQGLPGLTIEADALADLACLLRCHQPAFLARFLGTADAAFGFLAVDFASPASMPRFSASIRLTTLLGFAAAFACLTGCPACLERMSSFMAFSYRSSNFSGSNLPVMR